MKLNPGLAAVLLSMIFLAGVSCSSAPKAGDTEPEADVPQSVSRPSETPAVETPPQMPQEASPPEEPVVQAHPEMPPEPLEAELAEPEIEVPETDVALSPPEEDAVDSLPEPEAAALALPPEPLPPAAPPPEPQPAPVVPPPAPSPPEPPVESPPPARPMPPPPPPPAFLGPAETERPPAIVREPVPMPPAPEPPELIRPITIPQRTAPDEDIIFSRIVRATVGQLVEIPFRGTGWVFLGEQASRRGIVYDSRRLDTEGQSFIFRTESAGTYALKFYKQDFVQNYILNDHVQVIVGEAPETAGTGWFNPAIERGRIIAEPRWPNPLQEAQAVSGIRPQSAETAQSPAPVPPATDRTPAVAENTGTAASPAGTASPPIAAPSQAPTETAESDEGVAPIRPPATAGEAASATATTGAATAIAAVPEGAATAPVAVPAAEQSAEQLPEDFLQKAREEFDAGRVSQAISLLDQFRALYPSGSDEAWWLYGQFYEANSPSRDILAALDYYRRLAREYPQSGRYNDARRRIAYLERYYINIQ